MRQAAMGRLLPDTDRSMVAHSANSTSDRVLFLLGSFDADRTWRSDWSTGDEVTP